MPEEQRYPTVRSDAAVSDAALSTEPPSRCILTVNGGSSSIKFAVFHPGHAPIRMMSGQIDRIGQGGASLSAVDASSAETIREPVDASDHEQGAAYLIDWLRRQLGTTAVAGIGHRVVHGGVRLVEHQIVTSEMIAELRRNQPLDLAHLPREIALLESFHRSFPAVAQVACFDAAFHRDLPRVAQLLPIPRKYAEAGVRRLGFHGLSYSYLLRELEHVAGPQAAEGRVILAHLGSGASMAAVHRRKPIDTTMAFTPTAGLVMGTRPGDLDPGLLVYMMRVEKLTPEEMDEFVSRRCGLVGVSQTSADMRDLIAASPTDPRAAEAVDLFCYQAKKWIGAFAAALGGLDTLVFSGGIGEHSSPARAAICGNFEFLGLKIDPGRNVANAPVISADDAAVTVRVIRTDEESVIARAVTRLLGLAPEPDVGPEKGFVQSHPG